MTDVAEPGAPAESETFVQDHRPTAPPVTAVVVSRGRSPFLAETLRALGVQTRLPSRVLLVDVGPQLTPSLDDLVRGARLGTPGHAPAARTGGAPRTVVLHVPGARTFGHAVRQALVADAGDRAEREWLWLLHDDSAPEPTALAELTRAVETSPSVAVAGAKQRTWTSPSRLLEVGIRTSRSGRRMADIAPGELDQGQHDGRDDVLGVGIAGALVRRDVWDLLRGPDPALGPFGDGFDLSRRARLAGFRVVVVPRAVVRHAQAGYHGLRGGPALPLEDRDADGEPDSGDPRRSFGARRRALLHQRLTTAPALLVPFVAVLALAAGLVRSLVRVASKEPSLAVAELGAPLAALARPVAVARARATARRTRRLPRRALRPLQAGARDVWAAWRDRRLTRSEVRRVVRAPSELELRELAALATRRRSGLAALVVLLVAVSAVGLGPLAVDVSGGARLAGGALLPAASGLGTLWQSATSGWISGGLGAPGPADALLAVLLPGTAVLGLGGTVTVVMLGSVLLAGLGAWFAAGAATRSVGVRLWAAVVWAALPTLLVSVDEGRLGAVLAHLALPWVALGIARAVGVQQADVVESGLATAVREPLDEAEDEVGSAYEAEPGSEHDAESGSDHDAWTETTPVPTAEDADAATGDAGRPVGALGVASSTAPDAVARTRATVTPQDAAPDGSEVQDAPVVAAPARPAGSIAAAAVASLALAVAVAGAPALLVPSLVLLVVVAVCAPRRRRLRVLLVALPSLALMAPTLVEAAGRGLDGVRLLLADAGGPWPSVPADAWQQLLGVPASGTGMAGALPDVVPDAVRTAWPLALGGVLLLVALLALLRGRPQARAVRLGWFAAALGLAVAVVAGRVVVAAADGSAVTAWPGSGLSLAGAGLLAAAVVGTRGARARIARASFGWRQVLAGVLVLVGVLVPLATWGEWAWRTRQPGGTEVVAREVPVVPAIGQQSQQPPEASRVLALQTDADGVVTWQLLRADGPQLVDAAAAVGTRMLSGSLDEAGGPAGDAATAEVGAVVGDLAVAASRDVSGDLASLAVADVLVPPLTVPTTAAGTATLDAAAEQRLKDARERLVGRLDSTAGLERITEGASGVIWRVQPVADQPGADAPEAVTAWARLTDSSADEPEFALDADRVDSDGRHIDTTVPAGSSDRRLVLAERADAGWTATLDGKELRGSSDGWRQTFEIGAGGGRLVVSYQSTHHTLWMVGVAVVVGFAALLAVPVRRRRAGRR